MITVPQPLGEVDDELLLETLLPLVDGFGEDELASDEDPDSNDEAYHANDYPEDDESSIDDDEPRRMRAPRRTGGELLAHAWDSELDAAEDER